MSTVFYSWQSDLPETRNVIQWALQRAIKNLNRDLDLDEPLRVDQDTEGVAGWPDITTALFDKIDQCEIFVADITPINGPDSDFRITPNPNVLLELGYALGTGFGRTRIICVINTHYLPNGDLRELPFDLRGSRPVQFTLEDPTDRGVESGQEDPTRTRARADLAAKLEKALATVMEALEAERLAAEAEMLDDGLTEESRLVLAGLMTQVVATNDSFPYTRERDDLEAVRKTLGMSEQEMLKELTRLDQEGCIEFQQDQGFAVRCNVTSQGILVSMMRSDPSKLEAAYKRVAGYIYTTVGVEGQQRSVLEIAEGTEESPVLVDAVVDLWAIRDLVKTAAVRPQFRSVVWEVSPLLEEESSLQRTG